MQHNLSWLIWPLARHGLWSASIETQAKWFVGTFGDTHGCKWWDLTSCRAQLPSVSSGWHVRSLANIALWLRKQVMLLILDPIQLLVQVYGVQQAQTALQSVSQWFVLLSWSRHCSAVFTAQRRHVTAILPATSCFRYEQPQTMLLGTALVGVLLFRCSRKFHRNRRASGVYQ